MQSRFGNINTHAELQFKIMQLNNLRAEQELGLKKGVKELYSSLHPVALLRSTLSELASDKQIIKDAGTISMNLGFDFLIGKMLGNHMSIKKYLSSLLLNKAGDYILQHHPETVSWGVNKLKGLFKSFTHKNGKAQTQPK